MGKLLAIEYLEESTVLVVLIGEGI